MIKKGPLWVVLSFAVVFLAGAVSGVFIDKHFLSKPRSQERRGGGAPSIERMAKQLGLTAEQQDKIKDVFRRSDERFKELHGEMHKNLDAIRKQIKSEIDSILTEEQRLKLEALIHEQNAQRQKESNAGRRDNRSPRSRDN